MKNYLARIEIYDADEADYETLHKKMKALGFSREIEFKGVRYDMPDATYVTSKPGIKCSKLGEMISNVADPLSSKTASIFVCQYDDWSAYLHFSK
ncbi:DUF2622 domain-containing protein [Xenorhabdus bovienii]|uniref:DUF2622 domain-containing protein n=1 Tax=Xenorhabdus bovienii TaxID=40576 RepID=UPI00237C6F7B|nr:DUF2622 domain-containing protein [Xenorhabdus bovienii]MDE1488947.1 DUF2622 domain-containing protein [Xenorhabdus bovienii]MDE9479820.1 DUF2622 domain-containing protein [Xenorhabdus bovienii]MDE9519936.1 DUF2622 domain-containing protein [Xenorhabdus bovienii]MDE9532748.1 DUF2622 domain-containing protein [Xenorhabdus bovienii]